jgi:hypothetical protein
MFYSTCDGSDWFFTLHACGKFSLIITSAVEFLVSDLLEAKILSDFRPTFYPVPAFWLSLRKK